MEFYKVQLRNWSLIQYVPLFALCPKMETWILLVRLQPLLFDYFVLLAAAGWYQTMPSGGSNFWEEMTCNLWKLWYNHDTLGWDEGLVLGEENSLTHVFDPCWNRGRRLPAEEENLPALSDGSKTGREKPLENLVSATLGKVNTKWSWMCRKSKLGSESCLVGWPIARPHFWPMFWPIRDQHAVDGGDSSGLSEVANSVKRIQSGDYLCRKLCKPQLITRRS